MSKIQSPQDEQLLKSIDAMIDELFVDEEKVEKSAIDIAQDASTKADDAANQAPKAQKDESRGAGRPKQISDVPQVDQDGRRDSEYDSAIADKQKEDEPEETDQSESQDQTQEKKRIAAKPKAPAMRPFKKSNGEEISEEEYKEFQEFKKSKLENEQKAKDAEVLQKAAQQKKDQEDLIKAVIEDATAPLRKSLSDAQALIKAMASQPQRAKSVTGIEALEKSAAPEEKSGDESFSKSDVLDAAFELAKSGKISDLVVSEIEMTGRVADPNSRKTIESYLESK